MTIMGVVLLAAGGVSALLFYLGMVPAFLQGVPVTLGTSLVVAAAGLALMVLERRPAD